MAMMISDGGGVALRLPPRQDPSADTRLPVQACVPPPSQGGYRPEPAYHPGIQAPGAGGGTPPSATGGEYGIPEGGTLGEAASGTPAQPFDVTLSQLATAVYGTRGAPPEGWTELSDQDLAARLGTPGQPASAEEVQDWRLTFLGFNDSVGSNDQEFRAQVYTDGEGNYVLSYRGTSDENGDWDNNFRQGLGYETRDGDKFSVTAANTGREFADVFGDGGGNPTDPAGHGNLAITGHSQGGGLATVGSIASGVPAVTFDASGIHPNTWDRLGIDPQAARDIAENGGIRAYSLSGDALTQAQDSWVTGVVAPDALGTQIVVEPARADENNMFTHYGPMELDGMSPEQIALLNAGVEATRDPLTGTLLGAPIGVGVGTLLGGPLGGAVGLVAGPLLTTGAGHLAYSAISHSPNALTAAMIDREPWQAGYENPSSIGRDLQNLLPDELKDDFARNTHDLATDIDAVVATHFADGDYVEGGISIAGDVVEGFYTSAGDTVDRYADGLATRIDDNVGGWVGDVLSTGVDVTGDVIEGGADLLGQGAEVVADGVGWVAQGATDFIGGLFGG